MTLSVLQDQRYQDCASYAKKVEEEVFETASGREDYYQTVGKKILRIMAELQEKKRMRAASRATVKLTDEELLCLAAAWLSCN